MKYKIIILLLIIVPSIVFGNECIDWQKLRTEYSTQSTKKINEKKVKIVVVQPFTNYTKHKEDEWLVLGMRDLLADMLEAGGRDLLVYSGFSAIYNEQAKHPNYVIKGMVQKRDEYLRVFIFVNDGQTGQLIKQFSYSVFYPQDADFFQSLGRVTTSIIELTGSGLMSDNINEIANASGVPMAYATYSLGMQSMMSGNLKNVEIALDYFNESKRLDPKSLWAYLGTIDTLAFAALRSKLTNRAFGSYLEQMEGEINRIKKIKKNYPIARWALTYEKGEPKSRFSVNQGSFIAGLYAAQEGKLQEAANNLQNAVNAVPEDAVSWIHLARIYGSLGNYAGSTQATEKANQINSCSPQVQLPTQPVIQQEAPKQIPSQPTPQPEFTTPTPPPTPSTAPDTEIMSPSPQGSGVKSKKRSWGD